MPEPVVVPLEQVQLQKVVTDNDAPIAVYTEGGLEKLLERLAKQKNDFASTRRICYNKPYDQHSNQVIVVNPTVDEVHTYRAYDWDFRHTGAYACIDKSFAFHREQVQKMVPSYVDCKAIYRLLKENKKDTMYLHKMVEIGRAHV